MITIDWAKDKEGGNFKPELSQAMDLMWWAKQTRLGRQLPGSDIDVRNKLLQLPTNRRIVNGQLNGKFKSLFLGVEGSNYSLYRDVTTQVNQLIQQAMQESRQILDNYRAYNPLSSFLVQIYPLIEEDFSGVKDLSKDAKSFIAVLLTFAKKPSIIIEGIPITISKFLKKNLISYFWSFLYKGPWAKY